MSKIFATIALAGLVGLSVNAAAADVNLIQNGNFATGNFTDWTVLNNNLKQPSAVIAFGSNAKTNGPYSGAFGEVVPVDNAVSIDPDKAGQYGAYFVDDNAKSMTIEQLTYLTPGNYRIGFDAYLTQNGFNNKFGASFAGTIIGTLVTSFSVGSVPTGSNITVDPNIKAKVWTDYSGVAQITKAGYYKTDFVYSSYGAPAKDVVIDRVYALATTDAATVVIPPNPSAVPEPAAWTMMILGVGAVGLMARRRRAALAAPSTLGAVSRR